MNMHLAIFTELLGYNNDINGVMVSSGDGALLGSCQHLLLGRSPRRTTGEAREARSTTSQGVISK
jgi:hypothetical protein